MITVTECTFLKEWSANGRSGKVYTVKLSDDTAGQSFGEIPIGTSKEDLEITPNGNYPARIKLIKKNGFAGAPKKVNNAAFAMSYAKDLVVADKVKIEQLLPTAEKIFNWIESKK
jgi:hypothetical protein